MKTQAHKTPHCHVNTRLQQGDAMTRTDPHFRKLECILKVAKVGAWRLIASVVSDGFKVMFYFE